MALSKELIRPVPATWWLKRGVYVKFMVREWTSLFVGAYCFFLLELIYKAGGAGSGEFTSFYEALQQPCAGRGVLDLLHLPHQNFDRLTGTRMLRTHRQRLPDDAFGIGAQGGLSDHTGMLISKFQNLLDEVEGERGLPQVEESAPQTLQDVRQFDHGGHG